MSFPRPSEMSKNQIFEVAEQFSQEFNYTPETDIQELLIQNLNAEIHEVNFWDLENSDDGSMVVKGKHIDIYIANHVIEQRKRFTLAHELGHYILHYLLHDPLPTDSMNVTRFGSDILEWQANWFASSFLMPESLFKEKYYINNNDLYATSLDLNASFSATEVRAKILGLIN